MSGLLAVVAPASAAPSPTPAPPQPVVSGNRLLDARTALPLRVAGVNRSGSEYACAQGWGIFDGPVDDTALRAIASWGTNTVRVPLNESCWLGANGAPARWSGATYRTAVVDLVDRLHAQGQAVILDLHWSAATTELATSQAIAPGRHSAALWESVATTFRDDPSVMFELFNEPREIGWECWRDGCTTAAGWRATGMQELVDTVRATGAEQPIIVNGLNWAGDLSGWSAHAPTDPLDSLVAGWHIYDFSQCSTASCWEATAGVLSDEVPVLLTEVGQSGCATWFLDRILPWADRHRIGFVGWSWNASSCADGPSLVKDYAGTPTAFGAGLRRHIGRAPGTPGSVSDPQPQPPTDPPSEGPGGPVADPNAPSGTARPADARATYAFEGGAQGWTSRWGGLDVRHWSGRAHTGSGALALDVPAASYAAAGVEVSDALSARLAGAELSMRVWVPQRSPGDLPVTISPMVLDRTWAARVEAPQSVVPGTWSTVSMRVPSGGLRVLGLQVDNASDWTGTVFVDDVRVGASLRAGFDATTDGWGRYWGRVEAARRTTTRFAGAGALAVRVRERGYPAVATTRTAGLLPGMRVTLRVHAPRAGSPAVRPVVLDQDFHTRRLPIQSLRRGWNTLSFTVPADLDGVRVVGVQVENGRGWRGVLGLDQVVW